MLIVRPQSMPAAATPATTAKHKKHMNKFWAIPIVVIPLAAAAAYLYIFCSSWLRQTYRKGSRHTGDFQRDEELVWQGKNSEFSVFDFEQLLEATNHFSEENKLGQGGFGSVYKKRRKILVYEYLPNKSLDYFIFDENRRALLDWNKRIAIIEGIAHGLLSTGYMAPEYACEGLFSIKSDVFSFGVLVLEILGGKRNSGSSECGNFINLLGYAWQLYKEGIWSELIDASLVPIRDSAEVMRCMNIALLCVQEKAADRPTMLDVVAMLSSKTMVLAEPKRPGYFNLRVGNEEAFSATRQSSINDMTISVTTGR
ncbi:cysteine-rich receptor-like protein kinase 10 [Panicum miliaceum]|uniref:Cysteine-rich receptor-like protein kinase 10 n=1 Tax=Panicum miliaceum TaxID=4540 RepID=A0A3L6T6F0_PANMI|nr:cysteine-rich receptor-like protein kinase 10 [Panicum miliaceum]